MGRPPKPGKILELHGRKPGHDAAGRKIKQAPKFERVAPTKPADLSDNASEHWDLLVSEMGALELLKRGDLGSLVMLCEAWARWKAAQAMVLTEGVTILSPQGLKKHPAVSVAEAAVREYRSLAMQFGLTPASETSLQVMEAAEDEDEENPFAGHGAN